MHLLVIILQQLLGMLKSKKPAAEPEVVRPRHPEPRGSEPKACQRMNLAWDGIVGDQRFADGWMTVLPTLDNSLLRFNHVRLRAADDAARRAGLRTREATGDEPWGRD
jgi:hypothetical protein